MERLLVLIVNLENILRVLFEIAKIAVKSEAVILGLFALLTALLFRK